LIVITAAFIDAKIAADAVPLVTADVSGGVVIAARPVSGSIAALAVCAVS